MKIPRSASPVCSTQQVPPFASKARFRQWCQSAGVVGTALAFCAGCPGAQLRPEPGDCPYVEEMEKNGLKPGMAFPISLKGEEHDFALVRDGKFTGVVPGPTARGAWFMVHSEQVRDRNLKILPPGTVVYGQAWTTPGPDPDLVMMRIDRVRTPDDREFRVCMALNTADTGVWGAHDRPEPGVARMISPKLFEVTDRWP